MTPVVLVHGFLATPRLMKPMEWRLARAGRAVITPDFAPLGLRDVRLHAGELDREVDRARHVHRVDRVDIVGVSLGGLIAMWWAQNYDGWSRVRRLCTVGAPVRGTWAAMAGVPLLGAFSDGVWQLLPTSPLIQEMTHPVPDGVVTTVSLAGDPLCPPERCAITGAENLVVPGVLGPLGHQWLMFSPAVAERIEAVLSR